MHTLPLQQPFKGWSGLASGLHRFQMKASAWVGFTSWTPLLMCQTPQGVHNTRRFIQNDNKQQNYIVTACW